MTEQAVLSNFDELWSVVIDGATPDEAATRPSREALEQQQQNMMRYLTDIRKFAAWNGEDAPSKLKTAIAIFTAEFPDQTSMVDNVVAWGKRDAELFQQAYKVGSSGKDKDEIKFIINELGADTPPYVTSYLYDNYHRGRKAYERYQHEHARRKSGKPLSTVKPRPSQPTRTVLPKATSRPNHPHDVEVQNHLHPNDIRALQPADTWTLVIDETGDTFDQEADNVRTRKIGRMVGVLVPGKDGKALPRLSPGWHAVDCVDPAEIDRVFQHVLDAPVGVLGFDVRNVPMTVGERWMDAVALLIDWVLRLMPVENPCRLSVLIEQRGVFDKNQPWDIVRRDCLRRLALAYPERAVRIGLDISAIDKSGSPLNGYVDAVAFTWAQSNASSCERLKHSQLQGTCLLASDHAVNAQTMLDAWDAFAQGINLPSSLWWDMTACEEARNPSALLASLLKLIGQEAQANAVIWNRFLAEVTSRMAASPVHLRKLADAVDWLQQYKPVDAELLPRMRLIWLTVNLARANHEGHTRNQTVIQTWLDELQQLGDRLFDEAAPLVCHADLHRAVEATNYYDFDAASAALSRWHDCPPAIPGLCYWGQVQSSLGQHAAFTGDHAKAIHHFKTALEAFDRLSDPQERISNSNQTGCYLAIAMMDDENSTDADVQNALETVTGTLPAGVDALATDANPSSRYAHHILLRWLLYRGNSEAKQRYLSHRASWKTDLGHPWSLIQLYRGLLLHETDPETACQLALDAARIAFEAHQGPVVRLIGACCRVMAAQWGSPWPESSDEFARLRRQLPAASKRIELLEKVLEKSDHVSALSLLSKALPFNFR